MPDPSQVAGGNVMLPDFDEEAKPVALAANGMASDCRAESPVLRLGELES
jgi:hypothetical protein